ncbi:PD40 domain-containing protein [Pseudomonas gingeri]|uniref:PD40 domain-containing protein n=1 Tax=Pseudomonas gingeri TaxID=117681 RepID=UPI0015A49F93|nr:PD40 domain-containing protein [Pseudomonas gingeri]NWD66705.1 PD40 domain-containing protein [Pseudomonas gingeri]
MRFFSIVIVLAIFGTIGMANAANAVSSESTHAMVNAVVPIPRLQKNIDFSDFLSRPIVKKLTFSPDGRYLAIVYRLASSPTDIVVWDMQRDKKQSHIRCLYDYGDMSDHELLWSRDGKIISFGAKRQWDPMTGDSLPDNPAIGRASRLNKDGSKMLTIVGAIGEPSYIYIYNTKDWTLQKLYVDGLAVQRAAWTAEDKIMVGVNGTKKTVNKTIDGRLLAPFDVGLRLLDPSGKSPTKTIWFPAVPDDRPRYYPWKQAVDVDLSVSNFSANQIALGIGRIINGKTMDILTYYSIDDIVSDKVSPGLGGMVFSVDGKYLFIKAGAWFDGRKPVVNSVIDTRTGKQIAQFGGGDRGIAISPNGQQLAVGDVHSVQIFSLH